MLTVKIVHEKTIKTNKQDDDNYVHLTIYRGELKINSLNRYS